MKKINYSWLGPLRPFAWAGALLFFIIVEGLIITAEIYHHLNNASPFHFWSLLIFCSAPLTAGYNFAGTFRRAAQNQDCPDMANAASASIAIMTFIAYTILAGTVAFFL
jgi:hypothetical protein